MEGSDDEFSDLEDVDECDGNIDLHDASPPEDPAGPPGSVLVGLDTDTAAVDS